MNLLIRYRVSLWSDGRLAFQILEQSRRIRFDETETEGSGYKWFVRVCAHPEVTGDNTVNSIYLRGSESLKDYYVSVIDYAKPGMVSGIRDAIRRSLMAYVPSETIDEETGIVSLHTHASI
jgi:hypothetical protein